MSNTVLKGGDAPLTTLPKVGDYIVAPTYPAGILLNKLDDVDFGWHVFKLKPASKKPSKSRLKCIFLGFLMPRPNSSDLNNFLMLESNFYLEMFEKAHPLNGHYIRLATKEERNAAILAQHEQMKAEKEDLTQRVSTLEADMVELLQDLELELT